jgi:hypothetical protein
MDSHGQKKTHAEITAWSDEVEANNPYNDPNKREWFEEQLKPHNLDPTTTSLFDWLEVDDKTSFQPAEVSH